MSREEYRDKKRQWPYIALFAAAAAVCALLMLSGRAAPERPRADIYVGGSLYKSVPLYGVSSPYEIELPGGVLLVEEGAVSMKRADCPDSLCVRQGRITAAGASIVCLPGGIYIVITGDEAGTDGISG